MGELRDDDSSAGSHECSHLVEADGGAAFRLIEQVVETIQWVLQGTVVKRVAVHNLNVALGVQLSVETPDGRCGAVVAAAGEDVTRWLLGIVLNIHTDHHTPMAPSDLFDGLMTQLLGARHRGKQLPLHVSAEERGGNVLG